jgi:hypothetical protein
MAVVLQQQSTNNNNTLNLNNVIKKAQLTTDNLNFVNLTNNIKECLKHNKQPKQIKPAIKNLMDKYEHTETDSTRDTETDSYYIPEFNDDLINVLTNNKDIIYNKNYKQETYLNNALFYMLWRYEEREVKIYAYGYRPTNYKYVEQLGNLYFSANEWFILFRTEPFNIQQFYKLVDVIYYNEN